MSISDLSSFKVPIRQVIGVSSFTVTLYITFLANNETRVVPMTQISLT